MLMTARVLKFILIGSIFAVLSFSGCTKDSTMPPGMEPVEEPVPHEPTPYTLKVPSHFPQPIIPADNPMTVEGVELGRFLFYDTILSGNNTISCATCHDISSSFTDTKRFSTGIHGIEGRRNSMPLINMAFQPVFFWDGRANTLEKQVLMPIQDHIEMAQDLPGLISELQDHLTYPQMFYDAFGTKNITPDLLSKAVAQFMRTIISGNSKYDKAYLGMAFLEQDEIEGLELMNSLHGADCFHCHGEGNRMFGDFKMRNNALTEAYTPSDFPDRGFGEVTGKDEDAGRFKTPSLRNVAVTAPYMHDGRFTTLEEVIDHYSQKLKPSINVTEPDFIIHMNNGGIHLTPQEKQSIIAFLHTLTDTSFVNDPALQDPFK